MTKENDATEENRSISRSFSLSKLFLQSSFKVAAVHSVPVTPLATKHKETPFPKIEAKHYIRRSLSVPVNVKTCPDAIDDSRGLIRVIVSTPRASTPSFLTHISPQEILAKEESVEDIREEEAVCRICMIELCEGGETLKMECSCKGELALAHKDCAVKWFTIKGNKTCDVCRNEVRNLPVTLLKLNNNPRNRSRRRPAPTNPHIFRGDPNYRVWQDVPILVIVSMMAYFCFLEQLMVPKLGVKALALALPLSCVLGLISALISSTMANRSYIWVYATFQFGAILLFAHIFCNMLHIYVMISVMLASLSGFILAISTNSVIVEALRWRTNQTIQRQRLSQQTPPPIMVVREPVGYNPQEEHVNRQMAEP